MPRPITNFLTIDVEEWFHVHTFSNVIHPKDWRSFQSTVEKNTYKILDILESVKEPPSSTSPKTKRRATFFILGWIAEHFPSLVKEIHQRGHEVACHGYAHQCIFTQERAAFKKDIKKAKAILEDLIGVKVIGYRAPTFSITEKTLWALNILAEEGFHYDSSLFPIKHDYYGIPSALRFPFIWSLHNNIPKIIKLKNLKIYSSASGPLNATNSLVELPISTVKFWNHNFPASGGGYFRLYPYLVSKYFLKRINKENMPFVMYIHPWEIDPKIPRIKNTKKISQFRTYINLDKTEKKFRRLLSDFHFSCIADLLYNTNFSKK